MNSGRPHFSLRIFKSWLGPEEPAPPSPILAPLLLPASETPVELESSSCMSAPTVPDALRMDATTLPNRDHLRRVVRDCDQLEFDARDVVDVVYDDAPEDEYQNAWREIPRRRFLPPRPWPRGR